MYSWRRFVDPKNSAPMAYQFYCIANAEEANTGKCEPQRLGIKGLDQFSLRVQLRGPTPFFLNLITQYFFAAVPKQSIEPAKARGVESSWTEPRNIVGSGAFTLKEYRRYEQLVALRNPNYYEASVVGIDELRFYPIVEGTTAVHLYRTGAAAATPSAGFPPVFIPSLRGKKDFHGGTALGGIGSSINTSRAPFDNVLLRYALNTATDKTAFSGLSYGSVPSRTVVPPMPGYPSVQSVSTLVDGCAFDLLTFNVELARALLAKSGYPNGIGRDGRRLEVMYHFPVLPETRPKADIHRDQWQRHLGIRVNLVPREFNEHFRIVLNAGYSGIAEFSFLRPTSIRTHFWNPSRLHRPGIRQVGPIRFTGRSFLTRTQ